MTDRPDKFPIWATDDVTDPISQQNNVIEPPEQKKQFGWGFRDKGARNWFNWLGRYTNLWLNYIDERLNKPESFLNGAKPSATTSGAGKLIYISDLGTGGTIAFSDGTNWRKVSDGSTI